MPREANAAGDTSTSVLPSADVSRSELKDRTFKSLRWATVARLAAELLAVGSAVVLAHLIPPDEFGRVAVAVVVSELALALANEGVGSALVQRRALERAHVESAALLSLMIGTVLTVATLFVVPFATTPLFGRETTDLFRLLAPCFLIAAVGIVPLAMLERELDFRRISMIEIATVLASVATSLALALAGLDAEAYVLGTVGGMAAWALLLVCFGPAALPRWHPRQLREIARFGLPAGLAGCAAVGYGNVHYAVLGATMSPTQVGFYYRAYTLGVLYQNKVSGIITRLAFPVYSRTEDLAHMRDLRARVMRINAVVIVPCQALFIAIAPQLIPWLFGQRWEPTVLPAQILAVAGTFRMINNATPPLILAAGLPRTLFAFNVYRVGLLGAAVFVASQFSLNAVCVAVAAFQLITLVGSYQVLLKPVVGVTPVELVRELTPAFAASAIMFAASFPVAGELASAGVAPGLSIALVACLAAPIYLCALRAVSRPAWNDLMMIASRVLVPGRWRKPMPAPAVTTSG